MKVTYAHSDMEGSVELEPGSLLFIFEPNEAAIQEQFILEMMQYAQGDFLCQLEYILAFARVTYERHNA